MTRGLAAGWIGLALLAAAGVAMAAAGPELVAAAGWVEERGGEMPRSLLGPFGEGLGLDGTAFYILLWVAFAGYLLTVVAAPALGSRAIWIAAVALITLFAATPPLLSQDVFSYIAYARIGVEHGLNPYEVAPGAIAADPVAAYVGWPEAVSVYGPVFTLSSYALAPLSLAASLWTLKVATAAAVLGTAALTARIATWRGLDGARAAAFVALNPLVLVHVVGGAHNDAFMVLALTASLALLLTAREASGAVLLAVAAAIKFAALFVAPFALLGRLRRMRFALAGILALAALVGISLIAFGSAALDSFRLVDENQSATSRYSVPATLSRALGIELDTVRIAMLAGFAVAVAWLALWTWRGGDWVRAAGWAGLATLLATGWLLPWYLIWVLPPAAISRDNVLCGLVLALTAFQLISRVPL